MPIGCAGRRGAIQAQFAGDLSDHLGILPGMGQSPGRIVAALTESASLIRPVVDLGCRWS
jgi:hypothetical protein